MFEQDLQTTLDSWNDIKINDPTALQGKKILILSSANIPIAWLYPTRVASLMGAESVTIKLPSLRDNDPLSAWVQQQIESLIKRFEPDFKPTTVHMETNKTLSGDFSSFDFVVVFGTQNTIETIGKKLTGTKTILIPHGEITNSLSVDTATIPPHTAAQQCSRWFGRGCLTPVCLFVDENDKTEDKNTPVQSWVCDFATSLEQHFKQSYNEVASHTENVQFMHLHSVLYMEAIFKRSGLNPAEHILKQPFTCVINALQLPDRQWKQLDLSIGGCGFVFILPAHSKPFFPFVSQENVTPKLGDPHGGKTWQQWFS